MHLLIMGSCKIYFKDGRHFLSRKFMIYSTSCICNILAEFLAYLCMRVLIVPVLFVCGALGNAK